MYAKDYYQSFIAVIDYVAAGHDVIPIEKGEELSGNYWPRIFRVLSDEKAGIGMGNGDFHITQGQYLNPIYEDCLHAMERIDDAGADLSLDRLAKISNMKYARFAFQISICAIVISATSLLWGILSK